MPLTRHSESSTIYLEAKHFCLWRQIKKPVDGCETLEVNNPKTGQKVTKYGYRYDTVAGFVTSIEKYDTQKKYSTRYFGFKLHMADGTERYVIDMPYQSQILRRFLRVAAAVEWDSPLSITVFKGKAQKKGGERNHRRVVSATRLHGETVLHAGRAPRDAGRQLR